MVAVYRVTLSKSWQLWVKPKVHTVGAMTPKDRRWETTDSPPYGAFSVLCSCFTITFNTYSPLYMGVPWWKGIALF